jgi:hypothetical protein
MTKLALLFLLGGLPITYSNVPNDGISKCSQIDAEVGRRLEQALDEHEKRKIYFNLLRWRCEDDGIFQARQFSRALDSLGEPSFALRSNAKGYKERLRLLAFSHSGAGYILRLDLRQDGSALLTFAESEWLQRSEHRLERRLKQKWSRPISPVEAFRFLAEVKKADILAPQFELGATEISTKRDDGSDEICINWATAVLERLDKEGRHTVAQTGCGRSDAIYPLIDSFHAFIGLEPLTLESIEESAP